MVVVFVVQILTLQHKQAAFRLSRGEHMVDFAIQIGDSLMLNPFRRDIKTGHKS